MNRKRKLIGAALIASIALPVVFRSVANADSYKCETDPIKVEQGDDYWGYLEQYCEGNLEAARGDVVEFYGPTLMPGQLIYLPSSHECELSRTTMEDGNEYVYESCPE